MKIEILRSIGNRLWSPVIYLIWVREGVNGKELIDSWEFSKIDGSRSGSLKHET